MLTPGNSPIGLRLPLKSLPFTSKSKTPRQVERSPFEELPKLSRLHETVQQRYQEPVAASVPPEEFNSHYVDVADEEEKDTKKKKSKEQKEVPVEETGGGNEDLKTMSLEDLNTLLNEVLESEDYIRAIAIRDEINNRKKK